MSDIEQTIRTTATRRLGAVDAMIVRVNEQHATPGCLNNGEWFALFLKFADGWKMIGRRRTKLELLEVVNSLEVRELDGKNFGRQFGPGPRDSRSSSRDSAPMVGARVGAPGAVVTPIGRAG